MPDKKYLKCYFGCRKEGVLHKFPKPDNERFNLWKKILHPEMQEKKNQYIYTMLRLCDKHFEQCYRLPSGKLNINSIPTLCIDFHQTRELPLLQDVTVLAHSSRQISCESPSESDPLRTTKSDEIPVNEEEICCLDPLRTTKSDEIPVNEEEICCLESLACDVDDPLAACGESDDEASTNPSTQATDPVNHITRPSPNTEPLKPSYVKLCSSAPATVPVNEISRLYPSKRPAMLKAVVPQGVPGGCQTATPSLVPQPATTRPDKDKPHMSKREEILLHKFQALQKEVETLRKRVHQIDKISSPLLKCIIESTIHNQSNKSKVQRWSQVHKSVAVKIYKRSPRAYTYLRQLMPMPGVETIQKLINKRSATTTSDVEVDEADGREPAADANFKDIVVNELDEHIEDLATPTISLTTPQSMEDQMDKLRRHIRHLTKVINKLKNQNQMLKERLAATGKSQEHILKRVTENMTPAAKVFTRMQYSHTAEKPGAQTYTAKEKVLTVSMFKSSPTGYAALSNFFSLPSEQLVKQFTREVQAGFKQSTESNEDSERVHLVKKKVSVKRPAHSRGRGGRGRGGKWSANRCIEPHDRLPPQPIEPTSSMEICTFVPEEQTTIDISDVRTHNSGRGEHYQTNLDLAVAGLTYDMMELQ